MGRVRPIRCPTNRALSALVLALIFLFAHQGIRAHPGVDEALRHYDRLIEQSPRDQALHVQRGIVYSNDGRYAEAVADFRRAEELGDPLRVSFDLGVLHYRMGDFPAARRYFDAWLQRFPGHAPGLEYRARLRRDAGDHDGSIADFRRVFALVPRPNPGDYLSVAQMLESRGEAGVVEALGVLDQANARLGITPQVQRKAIALELRLGQPDRAIERLRALEPTLGDSPDWKVEMGELLLSAGRGEQAQAWFRKAADQLQGLRPTPARQQLMRRAQGHLDATATGRSVPTAPVLPSPQHDG